MTKFKINHEIRFPNVLLLDENGNKLGVKPIAEAISAAKESGLDLVLVSEPSKNQETPVAKFMDYKKFLYLQSKKDKQNKKSKHEDKTKEFKIRPVITEHDVDTKVNQIKALLEKQYKIKVAMFLNQRQSGLKQKAFEIMKTIYEKSTSSELSDGVIKIEGGYFSMIFQNIKKTK